MDIIEIDRLYNTENKSLKEIADMFNTYPQKIHRLMNKHGIHRRTYSESFRNRHRRDTKYFMNDDFWIDWSPNLAWFLGLFYADGHIATDRTRCAITAHDAQFLSQIRDMLESNFLIQTKATTPQLIINSMDRVEQLESFGITTSKTHNMLYPNIPSEFQSHFVRGFLDGDGWIYGTTVRRLTAGFEIASKSFMIGLQSVIESLDIPTHVRIRDRRKDVRKIGKHDHIHSKQIIYDIRMYCSNAVRFLEWIYQDSTPINRWKYKYDKAKQFINH